MGWSVGERDLMSIYIYTHTILAFRRTTQCPSRPGPAPGFAFRAPHLAPFSPWTSCC